MTIDLLKKKFNIEIIDSPNSFQKVRVNSSDLVSVLKFLKCSTELSFEVLSCIIAIDLGVDSGSFELIYDLRSILNKNNLRISILINREKPAAPSVIDVFKSAHFDECEIFDLFGIVFENNPKLKRLFMPKGWIGHPLKKDYVLSDERLVWNEQ